MIKRLLIELTLLIRLFVILQPHKIHRLITNIHIANLTKLKVRYFNLDHLLDVSLLGTIPLDVLGDDFGELFVEWFDFVLGDERVGEANEKEVLYLDGE